MKFDSALKEFRATFTHKDMDVQPATFIRPDGTFDVSEVNAGDRDHVAAVNDFKRRMREATPVPAYVGNKESEL